MNILFIDTETTGLYNFKASHDDPSQPHLVQLAAVLHDEERKVRGSINLIIYPNGFEIPEEASLIHGITTKKARNHGVFTLSALGPFIDLLSLCDLVVAHNMDYDRRIIRTAFIRVGMIDYLEPKNKFCTMKESTNICKIPSKTGYKWPNLQEAHKHFTGGEFENAHDAMADLLACSRIYYALKDNHLNLTQ